MAKTESNIEKRDGKCWIQGTDIEILEGLSGLLVPVGSVKPREKNPRITKNLDMLISGIRRFGVRWPIVVSKNTGEIEAGHNRYEALVSLGSKFVPVLYADDDETTASAFTISDNRIGEKVAKWDERILNDMLVALMEEDALEGIGFSEDDIRLPTTTDDKFEGIVDLDELLEEVSFSEVVPDPIWIVIRAPASKRIQIETVIGRIESEPDVKVERSYDKA